MRALVPFVLAAAFACTSAEPAPTAPGATPVPRPSFAASTYMSAVQARGTLRVGLREDAPPFSARAAGRVAGFEADLARELARGFFGRQPDIDRFIEWVPVLSATRVPALESGRADLVLAGLAISEERRRQIDLTSPYYGTGQRLLVKRSNDDIRTLDDVGLETVCTARGSPSYEVLRRLRPGLRILELDTYEPCLEALAHGQADVVSTDETILFAFVLRDPSTKIVGPRLTTEEWGVGVKKDSGDRAGFLAFLDEQLASLVADGRWAAAYRASITPLSGDERRAP